MKSQNVFNVRLVFGLIVFALGVLFFSCNDDNEEQPHRPYQATLEVISPEGDTLPKGTERVILRLKAEAGGEMVALSFSAPHLETGTILIIDGLVWRMGIYYLLPEEHYYEFDFEVNFPSHRKGTARYYVSVIQGDLNYPIITQESKKITILE